VVNKSKFVNFTLESLNFNLMWIRDHKNNKKNDGEKSLLDPVGDKIPAGDGDGEKYFPRNGEYTPRPRPAPLPSLIWSVN